MIAANPKRMRRIEIERFTIKGTGWDGFARNDFLDPLIVERVGLSNFIDQRQPCPKQAVLEARSLTVAKASRGDPRSLKDLTIATRADQRCTDFSL